MRRRVLKCLLTSFLASSSLSQVIIRERIQIRPVPHLIATSTTSSASYLSPPTFQTPAVGPPSTALPSNVTVEGTIDFAPSQLELRQWALLRLTGVGQTAVELHYIEKTISGQIIERKSTFSGPVWVCGGGVPHLQTFDGSVGGASLQFNSSGSQVTYTLTGGLRQGPRRFIVPVTATATSSGSAQPGYNLAQWNINSSQDSLIGGETGTMTITALNTSGDPYFVCTTPNADATVTVSIQAQGEYAYLRGPDGQEGSTITIPFLEGAGFSAVKTCSVVLDESRGSIPNGRDVATVTVSGGSATSNKQIVLKTAFDHFEITLEKDEIAFTETSKIFVKAKDLDNNDMEINDDTELLFSLSGESAYGTFIKPNGDTVKTANPEVDGVKYSDAKAGKIIFAAVAANPATSGKPKIIVALQGDPSKKGEKEITVLEQHLKIVMMGSKQIRPIIPEEVIKLPKGGGFIIPNDCITSFFVQLTKGGQQFASHPFKITSDNVLHSGGHQHSVPRRTDSPEGVRFENYGYFSSAQETPAIARNPLSTVTLSNGQAKFNYTSSFFGDRMVIKVQSEENALLFDTVTVLERVVDLINLGSVSLEFFRLTGNVGTTRYPKCDGAQIRHPDNHYGTQYMVQRLLQAMRDFFDWSGDTEIGFGRPLVLSVNDMSLPFGGLFDICGTWQQGHTFHRKGSSVDIDDVLLNLETPPEVFSLKSNKLGTKSLLDYLTQFMKDRGGEKFDEEPIHYGFGGK